MRTTLVTLGLAAVVLASAAPALAQDRPVQIEVWSIQATTKHDKIAPELKEIAESLKRQFKYTGFTLADRDRGGAKPNETYKAGLPHNYSVSITPKSREDGGRIKMQVVVTKKDGDKEKTELNTTVTVREGPFSLYGGWSLPGGDALIIAIRVR